MTEANDRSLRERLSALSERLGRDPVDEDAWARLWEAVAFPLHRWVRARGRYLSVSPEEVVVDVIGRLFLRVREGMRLADVDLWSYLLAACRYALASAARSGAGRETLEEDAEGAHAVENRAIERDRELRWQLVRARLTVPEAALLTMALDGMKPREMAEVLHVSPNAVSARLYRLQAKLKTIDHVAALARDLGVAAAGPDNEPPPD